MAALTWREVAAPNFSSSNDMFRTSAQLLDNGFESAMKALDGLQEGRTRTESARLMQAAMGARTPLEAQTIAAKFDPRYLDKASLNFLAGQPQSAATLAQTQAGTIGTGLRNEGLMLENERGEYTFGRTQDENQRNDFIRTEKEAMAPALAEIQTLARNGDVEGARKLAGTLTERIAKIGGDPGQIMSGIDTQVEAGRTLQKNDEAFRGWTKSTTTAKNSEELLTAFPAGNFQTKDDAKAAIAALSKNGISNDVINEALTKVDTWKNWDNPSTPVNDVFGNIGLDIPEAAPADTSYAAGVAGYRPDPRIDVTVPRNQNTEAPMGIIGSLAGTESGGRFDAKNNVTGAGGAKGHFGRLQFGQARLQEAKNAGVIPQNMTPNGFLASRAGQEAVEQWHFQDIDRNADRMGLTKYIGQNVGGVTITQDSIRAMAHLGGIGGAKRYLESGGRYNPADAYGTSLKDYAAKHANASNGQGPGPRTLVPSIENAAALNPADTLMNDRAAALAAETEAATEQANRANEEIAARVGSANTAATTEDTAKAADAQAKPPAERTPEEQAALDRVTAATENALQEVEPTIDLAPPAPAPGQAVVNPNQDAATAVTAALTERLVTSKGEPIPEVDPRDTRANQAGAKANRETIIKEDVRDIARRVRDGGEGVAQGGGGYAQTTGGIYDYFMAPEEQARANEQARARSGAANEFWQSDEAQTYFQANPGQLQTAAQDPVSFAEKMIAERVSQTPTTQAPSVAPSGSQSAGAPAPAIETAQAQKTPQQKYAEVTKAKGLTDAARLVRNDITADNVYNQWGNIINAAKKESSAEVPEVAAEYSKKNGEDADQQKARTSAIYDLVKEFGINPTVAGAIYENSGRNDSLLYGNRSFAYDMSTARANAKIFAEKKSDLSDILTKVDQREATKVMISDIEKQYEAAKKVVEAEIKKNPSPANKAKFTNMLAEAQKILIGKLAEVSRDPNVSLNYNARFPAEEKEKTE